MTNVFYDDKKWFVEDSGKLKEIYPVGDEYALKISWVLLKEITDRKETLIIKPLSDNDKNLLKKH